METEDVEERKEEEKPNRILFVSGLPSEVTDEMLRYVNEQRAFLFEFKTDMIVLFSDHTHSLRSQPPIQPIPRLQRSPPRPRQKRYCIHRV
jgi:hypothetical protein